MSSSWYFKKEFKVNNFL